MSESASASTFGQSVRASAAASFSPWAFGHYSSALSPLSVLSCATSQGVYPFPESGNASESPPSWASPVDGVVCVQLDGSYLPLPVPTPTVTITAEPTGPPSSSPDETALLNETRQWRELFLYSTGILIFLAGIIAFRSRRA